MLSLKEVVTYYQSARDFCDRWHKDIERRRMLYGGNHYSDSAKKKGELRFNDPTYQNTVDLAVGIMLANQMDWRALDWRVNVAEGRDTSKVEKYLQGTLTANKIRYQLDIDFEVFTSAVRDGVAVLYTTVDPLLFQNYLTTIEVPDENSPEGVTVAPAFDETPIRVEVVDALKVSVLPGGPHRYRMIYRAESMTIYDVEALYNITTKLGQTMSVEQKMSYKADFVDAWWYELVEEPVVVNGEPALDETTQAPKMAKKWCVYNCVMFGFEPVFEPRKMDGYDAIPYDLGFFKPVGRDKPEDWGKSIIDPLMEPVSWLERAINRRQRQIDLFTSLPFFTKMQPGRNVSIDPGLGNILKLLPNEDAGFPQWPGNPPDVMIHIDFLRSRIQQSGFSDVMFGSGPSAASGFAVSQLNDMGRIRLQQPIVHLQLFWSVWAKKVLDLTKRFAGNAYVRVYGSRKGEDFAEMVKGDDVADFLVLCMIRPEFPNEEVRKTAMSTQVRGVLSERTIMERYLNIQQPDDERQRKIDEVMESDPVLMQYVVMKKLQDLAKGGDEAAKMVLQSIQQKGMPGQPGRPREANAPMPLNGLQSPNGQATPQAGGALPPGQDVLAEIAGAVGASPNLSGGV